MSAQRSIEPRHEVRLTDAEVAEILEALEMRNPLVKAQTWGSDVLYPRLARMPGYYEGAPDATGLTPQGREALQREVLWGMGIDGHNPHADKLRDAIKEDAIATAYFTISIEEGKPGPERNAAVDRRETARAALGDAALEYGLWQRQRYFGDCQTCHGDGTIEINPSRNGDPQMARDVACPDCRKD